MSIGTLFTLFIVPSVYVLLAKDHRKQAAREIDLTEIGTETSDLPAGIVASSSGG